LKIEWEIYKVNLLDILVPEAPENVSVHNITTNSTIIHWSPIKSDKANGILQGYEVILSPGNFSWTEHGEEITTVAVKNLNPDTQYTVSVLGLNINGEGERKSKTFKTKGNFEINLSELMGSEKRF
jgi:hypothetical protein